MNYLKNISLLIIALIFASCSDRKDVNKTFMTEPSNIIPNSNFTVYYKPDSTNLSGVDSVNVIAYLFGKDLNETIEQKMLKAEDYFYADIKISDTTFGVIFTFGNEEVIDNNHEKGYVVLCVDENENPMPEAIAGFASAQSEWGYYPNIELDKEAAKINFEKAFSLKPELISDFANQYFRILFNSKNNDGEILVNKELEKIEAKNSKSQEDLEILSYWFGRISNSKKSGEYKEKLKISYPHSEILQQDEFMVIRNEQDFTKRLKLAELFKSKYPTSDYIKNINSLIANDFLMKNDYKGLADFIMANNKGIAPIRFYSYSNRILEKNGDIKIASNIIKLGIERAKSELKNPSSPRPKYFSDTQWEKDREASLGYNLFVYSKILEKENKLNEALEYISKAFIYTNSDEIELNELYIRLLQKTNKMKELIQTAENLIVNGKSSSVINEILKSEYSGQKSFDDYYASLKNQATEKMLRKLKSEMLNLNAPEFNLKNLEGKPISLASLKGKIVILDFWATWCGPCRESFPGMKKAVEKYSSNPDIQFLFVNTWENVQNKLKNAREFIKKNNYPFNVLLDEENKVVTDYKVAGIPTKFILDKAGTIRFKSVGYGGNQESLVEELTMMIDLLNKN